MDSLTFETEYESPLREGGYYASFFARDLPGEGDTYWIRTFDLGEDPVLGLPNISFDGAGIPNNENDGGNFVIPIREGINPGGYLGEETFKENDSIRVELHAITLEAWNYLDQLQQILANEGLFAEPLANLPSNLITNKEDVIGFFSVSNVSALSAVAKPE